MPTGMITFTRRQSLPSVRSVFRWSYDAARLQISMWLLPTTNCCLQPRQDRPWACTKRYMTACTSSTGERVGCDDRPTLRAVNPTTWINKTDDLEQEFQPSLRAFATQRTDLLAVLEPLTPADWSRAATVTGAGKVLERTVLSYAQWLACHERPHVKQIERIVNTMHQ